MDINYVGISNYPIFLFKASMFYVLQVWKPSHTKKIICLKFMQFYLKPRYICLELRKTSMKIKIKRS